MNISNQRPEMSFVYAQMFYPIKERELVLGNYYWYFGSCSLMIESWSFINT